MDESRDAVGVRTPGQWSEWRAVKAVDAIGGGWTVVIQRESGAFLVLEVGSREADARLIAAAPELLEALTVTALTYHAPHFAQLPECTDSVCKQAWRAIAKARGES